MGSQLVERTIEDAAGRPQRVQINLGESPLAWLRSRGHVSERQWLAGEQLRADWERAGLGARVTMRWDAMPRGQRQGGGAPEPGVATLSARARFDGAVAAAGPGLSDIMWRVVCAGEGLPEAEKHLGWPARSGKLVLRIALERVAEFYRIT